MGKLNFDIFIALDEMIAELGEGCQIDVHKNNDIYIIRLRYYNPSFYKEELGNQIAISKEERIFSTNFPEHFNIKFTEAIEQMKQKIHGDKPCAVNQK